MMITSAMIIVFSRPFSIRYLAMNTPNKPPKGLIMLSIEMKVDWFSSVHPNLTMNVSMFGFISIIERPIQARIL